MLPAVDCELFDDRAGQFTCLPIEREGFVGEIEGNDRRTIFHHAQSLLSDRIAQPAVVFDQLIAQRRMEQMSRAVICPDFVA